ncbi:hypothetical protein [Litorimonas sp. WD9-15]|uniref:hypothetical protein n=1 Tax=Litorimonas sp. WD9-15 TaxID=3418716 RepID=UPI003D08D06A
MPPELDVAWVDIPARPFAGLETVHVPERLEPVEHVGGETLEEVFGTAAGSYDRGFVELRQDKLARAAFVFADGLAVENLAPVARERFAAPFGARAASGVVATLLARRLDVAEVFVVASHEFVRVGSTAQREASAFAVSMIALS